MEKRAIIFMGRAGSGKGTQARLVLQKFQNLKEEAFHLETGKAVREFLAKRDKYTQDLSFELNERGELQPQFLAVWVWASMMINNMKADTHLIIDGAPRRLPEAKVMETAFEFYGYKKIEIVNLQMTDEISRDRLAKRHRHDDVNAKVVERRLDWFETDVLPIIDYYKEDSRYIYHGVDGTGDVESIHKEVCKKLFK